MIVRRLGSDAVLSLLGKGSVGRRALAGALLLAMASGLGFWLGRRTPAQRGLAPVARLTLKIEGEGVDVPRLSLERFFVPLALSPDGTRLVFHARGPRGAQLFYRELSSFETRALPGTETATTPFFSPDGNWVGFWRAEDHMLRRISVAGGPALEIAATEAPFSALWGDDDEIVFEDTTKLWSVQASGGKPEEIVVRDRVAGERIELRSLVAGRKDLLVAGFRAEESALQLLSRDTGTRRRLLVGAGRIPARLAPTGHLVYADGGALFAVAVDPNRLEAIGVPVSLIHGIDTVFHHSNVAVSASGTVVYVPAEAVGKRELVWVDHQGNEILVPGGRAGFATVALAPSGQEAAIDVFDGTDAKVWTINLEHGARRLVADKGRTPIYSRDGAFITYVIQTSAREGRESALISRRRADGTGKEERLAARGEGFASPADWSPDGRHLLFTEYSQKGDTDVWVYTDGAASPLLTGPNNEEGPTFSKDGRFVAFVSDDGGEGHVYVQPFPGPGPRTAISIGESIAPRWAGDGRTLYFISGGKLMAVTVETSPRLRVGSPRVVCETKARGLPLATSDGQRFLMSHERTMVGPSPEFRVVLNWFTDLERLAAHPGR